MKLRKSTILNILSLVLLLSPTIVFGNDTDDQCSVSAIKKDLVTASAQKDLSAPDSVTVILNRALECSEKLGNKQLKAEILLELGKIELRKVGPRDVPTQLFLEALSLYTELEDVQGILSSNLQLAVLNFDIRNFEAASEHLNSILASEIENPRTLTLAYYLSALSYSELEDFTKAEEMFGKLQNYVLPADSAFNLQVQTFKGKFYLNKGEPERAIELFNSITEEYQEIILQEHYAPIYAFKARAYFQLNDYKNAISNANLAYRLSLGDGSKVIYLREAQSVLQQSFYATGNLDSAYYFLQSLNTLEDSLSNEQIQQRITQMSGQFDFQQKLKAQDAEQALKDQLAVQEIKKEKLLRNITLIGFLVVVVFAVTIFRQRSKLAKEKERSDNLLLNILPEEIAQELKEHGRAEAKNFDNVSILFTDFEKFTQTSENLTASELVAEINTCFESFDQIVDKYDLEKIKTIGDAYMAAGGLPVPSENTVKRTLMAALEMQHFIAKRNKKQKDLNLPYFEMRVGINTGPVVAGIVGTKKFQYDVWGDTVNTASRMESHGEAGEVNISTATYTLVKNDPDFSFESREKIEVKGKGEMEMWFVRFKNQEA